jgi:hypothetical protein
MGAGNAQHSPDLKTAIQESEEHLSNIFIGSEEWDI